MPELPDITVYIDAFRRFIAGRVIKRIIVWILEDDLYIVFHLMVAGRFHWKKPGTLPTRKVDLAAFQFEHGSLLLTEASQKKRASIHVVQGRDALAEHDSGSLEVLDCSEAQCREVLLRTNRTLKRALTDPDMFSGIGNAYSDEILHAARLSPVQLTSRLNDAEINRLFHSVRRTCRDWIARLAEQTGDGFPEKVTAFRPEMAVHGRYGQQCPVCGLPVQRIVRADNEINYCPKCQTGGRVLKDSSLSRLLRDDWPDEVEDA